MKLNPLIKIENITEIQCVIKLLIDKKSYQVDRDLFLQLIDGVDKTDTYTELQSFLANQLSAPEDTVAKFLNRMTQLNILLDDTKDYPVDQIEYWQKHKWLNALIYHLESQNIVCFDDGSQKGEDRKSYEESVTEENIWKTYSNCQKINLPDVDFDLFEEISLEEVLLRRNSFSPFKKKNISLTHFSSILSMANRDLSQNRKDLEHSITSLYHSSFSALETYIFIFSVEDILPGLYHYHPKEHAIYSIEIGDFKNQVTELCIGQRRAAAGGCLFLLTANPSRYMQRYKHERAYRNILTNVAEFAHQYVFYSTALAYSTFITPAIKDDYASELLSLKGLEELPLYTVAIG